MTAFPAGALEELLDRPGVTDVLVNGPDRVWLDRGGGLERAAVTFTDEDAVRALAVRLAAVAGRRLDAAAPFVDARLPGAVRLHAVLSPVATTGTCLSLRVLGAGEHALTALTDACGPGPTGGQVHALLAGMVRARLGFVVTGGTGSGKTTLLRGLLELADPRDRVVVVEDATELAPRVPHLVCLEARPPNVEGAGAIGLRELVRQALRMRPDRLVVGEVRGGEIAELLLALNTGHEGGATTLHANGPDQLVARLEALGALAGMPREAVHGQAAAGLQVVVHLARDGAIRRVREIGVLDRAPGRDLAVRGALSVRDGTLTPGPGAGTLRSLLEERGAPVPPILR